MAKRTLSLCCESTRRNEEKHSLWIVLLCFFFVRTKLEAKTMKLIEAEQRGETLFADQFGCDEENQTNETHKLDEEVRLSNSWGSVDASLQKIQN